MPERCSQLEGIIRTEKQKSPRNSLGDKNMSPPQVITTLAREGNAPAYVNIF